MKDNTTNSFSYRSFAAGVVATCTVFVLASSPAGQAQNPVAGQPQNRVEGQSLDEKIRKLRGLGASYLGRVYPGELSPEEFKRRLERNANPTAPEPERVIWTNFDELEAPPKVHSDWSRLITTEVPDWRRENVRIYPFITGQRVDLPGGKIEDLDVRGYVVEQTGIGTSLEGKPYRVQIAHVFFVKDGKVVRDHQYWGAADAYSMALTQRTADSTRGAWARSSKAERWPRSLK